MIEVMALIGITATSAFLGAVASQIAWCMAGANRLAERLEIPVGLVVAGLTLMAGIALTF